MAYFSRLTDIVTCSLTKILEEESDPRGALERIVSEMEEGFAGAQRSVTTAEANEVRLSNQLEEHKSKIDYWAQDARKALVDGNEDQARLALVRKREVQDLIDGLAEHYDAAVSTREHLIKTQRALQARLAEARRRMGEMDGIQPTTAASVQAKPAVVETRNDDCDRIEDELAALKRELDNDTS